MVGKTRPDSADTDDRTTFVTLSEFNTTPADELRPAVSACLGVDRWVDDLLAARPFADLLAASDAALLAAPRFSDAELDAALARHPRIGQQPTAAHDEAQSRREQAGVGQDEVTAARLAEGNRAYEARFGHVFLIRAAGRSGAEILAELERQAGQLRRRRTRRNRDQPAGDRGAAARTAHRATGRRFWLR